MCGIILSAIHAKPENSNSTFTSSEKKVNQGLCCVNNSI